MPRLPPPGVAHGLEALAVEVRHVPCSVTDDCTFPVDPHQHCSSCGCAIAVGDFCPFHGEFSDGWAHDNRLMCDLLHRGVVPSMPG